MRLWQVIIIIFLTMTVGCSSLQSHSGPPQFQGKPQSLLDATPTSTLIADLPPVRIVDIGGEKTRLSFARFGQCQFIFPSRPDPATGLHVVPTDYEAKIYQCFDIAIKERINVFVLPELAIAFPKAVRTRIIDRARRIAAQSGMIIIAGSFYDAQQFSRIAVISGQGLELGFKLRPSRYEASPRFGLGMAPGESLLVLHTPYGRLAVITCVDLISDSVQYVLRNLATRGEIDVIININYNAAAWEFLVEANSIARRHPVFVSITNVAGTNVPTKLSDETKRKCFPNGQLRDDGSCYGNSALFGSVRTRDEDCPNCFKMIEEFVGDQFKVKPKGQRSIPYDTMLACIPPFEEAMLTYELNLRLKREPTVTNAPDEGYPPVRGLRKIPLK
jgi:predicted amidohydrolase